MKRFEKRTILVNGFGALGYFILLLSWTLFAAIVIMGLLNASVLSVPVLESTQIDTGRPDPSGTLTVSAYIITGLAILATVAVVVVMPYLVGRWGSKLIRLILRAVKSPSTHRTVFSVKLVLLFIASIGMFAASFFLPPENAEVYAVQLVGSVCTILAIILFGAQHWLARRTKLAIEKVW